MSRDTTEVFFARLPKGRLTNAEAKVLDLLHQVAAAVEELLPHGISVQEWAEQRIPKEAAARANASRLVNVGAGAGPEKQSPPNLPAPPNHPPRIVPASLPQGVGQLDAKIVPASKQGGAQVKRGVASLPQGASPSETNRQLRELLHQNMERRSRNKNFNARPLVSSVAEVSSIALALEESLPPGLAFEDWIATWLGICAETALDERRKTTALRDQHIHGFFESLPADQFLPEEEDMRLAVVSFLEQWPNVKGIPATTHNMEADPDVAHAQQLLLPEGVSIRMWCHERMGEELEFMQPSANAGDLFFVGFAGQLDPERVEQQFQLLAGSQGKKRKVG